MTVAAASVPVSFELQLRVPASYAKQNARTTALRLFLYCLFIEALFVAYDVHAGHERLTHLGIILFITAFVFKPWLSLSNSTWVYAVNDTGIYLRDTSDVINATGFNQIRWDRHRLSGSRLIEWQGWPALEVTFLYKGRERTKPFVFRPEDESTVNDRLLPWLTAKSATGLV